MHFIRRRAGAAVVELVAARLRHRILTSYLFSNGTLSKLLFVPAGGPTLAVTPERYAQKLHKIRKSGRKIFKVAVRTLTRMCAVLPGASPCTGCKA